MRTFVLNARRCFLASFCLALVGGGAYADRTFTHPAENNGTDYSTLSAGSYTFTVDAAPNGYHWVEWYDSSSPDPVRTAHLYFSDNCNFTFTASGWVEANVYKSNVSGQWLGWEAYYRWNVTLAQPDLDVIDIWTEPANPPAGGSYVIKATVKNIGNAIADPAGSINYINTRFWVDNSEVDNPGGYYTIAAGDTKTYTSQSLTAPSATSISIKAKADSDSEVAESSETNNERTETVSLAWPDLRVKSIWTEPGNPVAGASYVIKACVRNYGNADANPPGATTPIYVKFWEDGVEKDETGKDGALWVYEIESDEEKVYTSKNLTAPSKSSITVKAMVDSQDTVDESSDSNNDDSETVSIAWPDLDVIDIWTEPANPPAGGSYVIKATVKNIGNAIADPAGSINYINTRFWVDNSEVDNPGGYYTIAAGDTKTYTSQSLTAPSATSISIKAKADSDSEVAESSETNNERTETVSLAWPDLRVKSIWTEPGNPVAGASYVIKACVRNYGNADANPPGATTPIYVKFWEDGVEKDETGKDGALWVYEIESDEEKVYTSKNLTAPSKSSITVKAMVDSQDTVDESSDSNNDDSETVSIAWPDLDVIDIWTEPANPPAGGSYVIKATVKNIGNAIADPAGSINYINTRFWVDSSEVDNPGGYYTIAAGDTKTYTSQSLTAPSATSISIKAKADSDSEVAESSETNNERTETIQLATGSIHAWLHQYDALYLAPDTDTKVACWALDPPTHTGDNPYTFTDVPARAESYWVEGYLKCKDPFVGDEEYWGSTDVTVPSQGHEATARVFRVMPLVTDDANVKIHRASDDGVIVAGTSVDPGMQVYASILVENPGDATRACKVDFRLDGRDGASDLSDETDDAPITASNSRTYYTRNFTVAEGSYHAAWRVRWLNPQDSQWDTTDSSPWSVEPIILGTVNRTEIGNILVSALDGGSVSPIIPGKRYVVTAEYSDADGRGDITAAWVYLRNPNDGRNVGIGYSFGDTDMKMVDDDDRGYFVTDGGDVAPVQDDYVYLTHVEKEEIPNGWKLTYIFWMTAKWANSDSGLDFKGVAYDAAEHEGVGAWDHKPVNFTTQSLPAGKWTVIVHGRSASGPFPGPWAWQSNATDWFDAQSRPDATCSNWMWAMANKLGKVSKSPVSIHRLDRTGMNLQTWNGNSYPGTYSPVSSGHNILLFDWDEPSDYVDLNDENFDDGYMYGTGSALYALLKKIEIDSSIVSFVGYSRGAVVVSEAVRRLRLDGKTGYHVVFLDGEGGGEFANEVRADRYPIGTWEVGPYYVPGLASALFETDIGLYIDNFSELLQCRRVSGFDDYLFHAWQGCRSDQYRQGYSNPDLAFCGAEAVSGSNDRTVEWWPIYSTLNTGGRENYGEPGSPGQISHSDFPVYFIDWLYLEPDSTLGGMPCAVTPQLLRYENPDARGTFIPGGALAYGSAVPVEGSYMAGGVFNGSLEAGRVIRRDGSIGRTGGSAAGWTYHGGTTPIDTLGALLVGDDNERNDIKRDGDGNYWFHFSEGRGCLENGLFHNLQEAPKNARSIRCRAELTGLLTDSTANLNIGWYQDNSTWVSGVTVRKDAVENVYSTSFNKADTIGRLAFSVLGQDWNDELLLDDVEFLVDISPSINTLSGAPPSVVRGADLTLTASNVQPGDNPIKEVRFYWDSNQDGDYDAAEDTPFGPAVTSGLNGNWTLTWPTVDIPIGQYHFFVFASDTEGLVSAPVPLPPQITITQPANQLPEISDLSDSPDPVDRGGNVTLTATGVSDPDGTVQRVKFYHDANRNSVLDDDDTYLNEDTPVESGTAEIVYSTSGLPAGVARFFAVAYDDQGAASAAVSTRCSIIQRWDLAYDWTPGVGGTITESPAGGRYADGTPVNPSAQAAANYQFDHWEVNGTTETMPVTLTADTTVTAVFEYNGTTVVPPVLNPIGNQSVVVGALFNLTATKLQGDAPITWTLEGAPSGMSINSSGVISWSNPQPSRSSNYITVKAQNSAGSDTESFTLYVQPLPDTTPPSISITEPTSGTVFFTTNAFVSLIGTAADDDEISRVIVVNSMDGIQRICSGTTNWSLASLPVPDGTNVITVTAYDRANNKATDSLTIFSGEDLWDPPDMAVYSSGITFSPSGSVAPGSTVTCYAKIYNVGGVDATCTVRFRKKDPVSGWSTLKTYTGVAVGAGKNVSKSCSINTTHFNSTYAYIYVDVSGCSPADSDTSNNSAYSDISVPVELVAFSAKRNDDGRVVLRWQTASETENKSWNIWRLAGLDDENAKLVNSSPIAGAGTAPYGNTYKFVDVASENVAYYMLEWISEDGVSEFSEALAVGDEWGTFYDSLREDEEASQPVAGVARESLKSVANKAPVASKQGAAETVDYLAIVPSVYMEALDGLLQHREGQGLSVGSISTEEIYAKAAEVERNAAIRAYLNGSSDDLRYVLLVGDAIVRTDGVQVDRDDLMPTFVKTMAGVGRIPTDHPYALSEDGELVRSVGRLPVSSVGSLAKVIAKIIAQESRSGSSVAVFGNGNCISYGDHLAVSSSEVIVQDYCRGNYLPRRIYTMPPSPYYARYLGTSRELIGAMKYGCGWLEFRGHGAADLWDGLLTAHMAYTTTTSGQIPIINTTSCYTGSFADPQSRVSIAEACIRNPNGGGVAYIGNTGHGMVLTGHEFTSAMWQELVDGEDVLGDAFNAAKQHLIDKRASDGFIYSINLFGDPATKIMLKKQD